MGLGNVVIIGGRRFDLKRQSYLLGVINVSPESPQQDSVCTSIEQTLERAKWLSSQGVSIVDIGAKSSFPGRAVGVAEEQRRLLPHLSALKDEGYIVSVDTWSPSVAAAALKSGADLINDISGLKSKGMQRLALEYPHVPFMFAHMRGRPNKYAENQVYCDVVSEVAAFFEKRIRELGRLGIPKEQLLADLGVGFGKEVDDSWKLISGAGKKLGSLCGGSLVSLSRKGFPVEANIIAAFAGVGLIRVHDPSEVVQGIDAVNRARATQAGLQTCYIGLGSNVEKEINLPEAISTLQREFLVEAVSSIYETAPEGFEEQPDFWNAVIRLKTKLNPQSLLRKLQQIEKRFGKNKQFKDGPRTLDLDLLLYGSQKIKTKDLVVPHPRMHLRSFVLDPLSEVLEEATLAPRGELLVLR